jgi:hypothetical protein
MKNKLKIQFKNKGENNQPKKKKYENKNKYKNCEKSENLKKIQINNRKYAFTRKVDIFLFGLVNKYNLKYIMC